MTTLLGEYECTLDQKCRIILPAALKKRISPEAEGKFVINRGFESCLVLYPNDSWKVESAKINRINLYNRKGRKFARNFYRGASELELDGHNRLLIPRQLLIYAGIEKDIVLFAYANRIEIWAKDKYDEVLDIDPDEYDELGEEVMDKNGNKELSEDVS
jgi:MraZ protein